MSTFSQQLTTTAATATTSPLTRMARFINETYETALFGPYALTTLDNIAKTATDNTHLKQINPFDSPYNITKRLLNLVSSNPNYIQTALITLKHKPGSFRPVNHTFIKKWLSFIGHPEIWPVVHLMLWKSEHIGKLLTTGPGGHVINKHVINSDYYNNKELYGEDEAHKYFYFSPIAAGNGLIWDFIETESPDHYVYAAEPNHVKMFTRILRERVEQQQQTIPPHKAPALHFITHGIPKAIKTYTKRTKVWNAAHNSDVTALLTEGCPFCYITKAKIKFAELTPGHCAEQCSYSNTHGLCTAEAWFSRYSVVTMCVYLATLDPLKPIIVTNINNKTTTVVDICTYKNHTQLSNVIKNNRTTLRSLLKLQLLESYFRHAALSKSKSILYAKKQKHKS